MRNLFLFLWMTVAIHAVERPNIILIMVDDMGRDWVSCYGAKHQTPNIDQLAREGVRYETAWSMPICTPTRVTLLTGQYPCHHGWVQHYDVPRRGGVGLRPDRFITFARHLRNAGYATAIGGKWQVNHLGKQPDILTHHGFDEHCVWPGAEADNPETIERFWNGLIATNGNRAKAVYGPDTINRFLIDFIQRNKDRPFLVYYPMLLTHGPYAATPLNETNPPEGKSALYAGNVTYMDHLIGKLVSAVDELRLAKRTIIIFTGDNGSACSGVLDGKPYPKGKGRKADWGVHVPFIVRAPFLTKGDIVSLDLIDFTDIYPTFLELAGIPSPKNLKLDGRSFVTSLRGSEDPFEKRSWIYSQVGKFRMIRDWHHFLDNQGAFHDIYNDPLKQQKVSPQDKIAPSRRQRLQMILKRFQVDAPAPFPEFKTKHQSIN